MTGPTFSRTIGILIFLFCSQALYAQKTYVFPAFREMDADQDDRVSHAEFYRGMDGTLLFEDWDNNHDGGLDRQELYDKIQDESVRPAIAVLEASYGARANELGYASREEKEALEIVWLKTFLRLADLNRDNRLNKAEFYLFMFRQYDTDENGSLIFREYAR